jgi:membrane protein implicated in regulation of membrane protease activity
MLRTIALAVVALIIGFIFAPFVLLFGGIAAVCVFVSVLFHNFSKARKEAEQVEERFVESEETVDIELYINQN